MTQPVDVAVVGSGPYALSVSAHLSARGIEHRIFGPPMRFWRSMPVGIFLKSPDFATNVYAPKPGFRFVEYCRDNGLSSAEPVPMALFAQYGMWAQQELVPHLEPSEVKRIARGSAAFEVELASGERLEARRVVVATGLAHFAYIPPVFRELPSELVSHTSDHHDYAGFSGREVAVIGRGASALEAAALLQEGGAQAVAVFRGSGSWLFAMPPENPRPIRHRILYPMSALGPGRLNFFLDRVPFGLHLLPDDRRVRLTRKHLGPWGPWWLAHRFEGKVRMEPDCEIVGAGPRGSKVALKLRNSETKSERELVVDHVILGTGYEPDVDVLPYMDPSLAASVARLERGPRLSFHFESSVPGLYFLGPVGAFSFGPLLRFVAGAEYAAPTAARHIARAFRAGEPAWRDRVRRYASSSSLSTP